MTASIALGVFVLFVVGSIWYVYRYRGEVRYAGLSEYLRKGWPVFTPLNCLLYLNTEKRARRAIMDTADFPELREIQENWELIREEAVALTEIGFFDQTTREGEASYYDVGFRTFYKYGWSKFYVTWYGYTHASAKRHCPRTVDILSRVRTVNGAMFTLLPPGSKLTRHLDPAAVSLRFHLGLKTPNDDRCFINVDGRDYSWRDGEALIFDETYLHYALNNTDQSRLILMCDVERPMGIIGRAVQWFYKGIVRFSVVPNTSEDKQGAYNRVFATLSPLLKRTKELKKTNRPLYKTLKYIVNSLLLVLLGAVVYGVVQLILLAF
ncbi:MAG: aspartyl/asparaginyl beta-hydroxylase domain-containing protein [Chromatiales bacterium]|nr:aspartyl/asparaginyl beta-hydroxylase domain-containing protein [Chromatiales bacterium]